MTKRVLSQGVVAAAALTFLFGWLHISPVALSATENKGATQVSSAAGVLFAKNCATCHGKDGQSHTFKAKFTHARDLTDTSWQSDISDEHLFNSISNGKGKMPAFGKKFSEAEINSLVAYVRKFKK